MDLDYSAYLLRKEGKEGEGEEEDGDALSPSGQVCQQAVLKAISRSRGKSGQRSVLSFNITTPSVTEGSSLNYTANMSNSISSQSIRSSQKRRERRLPKDAEKVLDAPGLVDDYYLNVLDWGKNNVLAIGLGSKVFLWNAKDGAVHELAGVNSENDYVSSVSWAGNGKYLAVGSSDASIQVRLQAVDERVLCVCVL
jgi:cell division cycle protein 20 (cofactor of APC complex)